MTLRALVLTVVHDPDDARIRFRQLTSLASAGAQITYAAPFTAYGRTPPDGVHAIDLPRAVGRARVPALLAARRVLHREAALHDVVLLHDPELLLTLPGLPGPHSGVRKSRVVWDVHEDTVASLRMKRWLPAGLRPLAALGVSWAERWAERRCDLLLAEESYRPRFRHDHPVVPNSVLVPTRHPAPPGDERVVYLGRLTAERGVLEMIELGRLLAPQVRVELIGPVDADVAGAVATAHRRGWVYHHGFVANGAALPMLEGALAGLALLHDQPNYARSRPTKVMEYMALGVPVVTTPNPAAADLVRQYGSGVVVPFQDPTSAAEAVRALRTDAARRRELGSAGRAGAVRDLDWKQFDGKRFGELLGAAPEPAAPEPAAPELAAPELAAPELAAPELARSETPAARPLTVAPRKGGAIELRA